ncbi:MAG: hypothetical protein ACE5OS_06245 [Anaerolineae bacterium]
MNLRAFSPSRCLVLLALAVCDLIVLCLLAVAVTTSLRDLSSARLVTPVAALPPTAGPSPIPSPSPSSSPLPTETFTPQPTNTRVVSREFYNRHIVEQIIEQVTLIRELEAATEVPFSMLSQEQMAEEIRALYGVEEIRAEVDRQWALYRALGLLAEDATIGDEEIEAFAANFAGLYVPEKRHIYIVTHRVNMSAEEETVFAHEYTHALQDQHFDLTSYLENATSTDADLAARALVEGDATVVMAFYAYGNTTQAEWEYLAYRASFAEEPELELEGISERAGRVIAFPYQEGAYFVVDLFLTQSWSGVNAAFADPPASTEQVLHPEKYHGHRDLPQEVTLPSAPGDGWQPVLEDTLGEFVLSVHLDEFLDDPGWAERAAAGWDGDRIGVWQDPEGRSLVLWQTVWDSGAEATEFEDAYRALIQARFKSVSATDGTWWDAPSVAVGLLREDDRVWVVWGPDRATAEAALEASR